MTLTILFFAAFFLAILWVVFHPLLQEEGTNLQILLDDVPDESKKLQARRSELMRTLKEMDFDYEMGKLSKEDYQILRKKFEQETVETLKAIDLDKMQRDEFQTKLEKKLKKHGE